MILVLALLGCGAPRPDPDAVQLVFTSKLEGEIEPCG